VGNVDSDTCGTRVKRSSRAIAGPRIDAAKTGVAQNRRRYISLDVSLSCKTAFGQDNGSAVTTSIWNSRGLIDISPAKAIGSTVADYPKLPTSICGTTIIQRTDNLEDGGIIAANSLPSCF